jgi:hypothetical protein
VHPRDIVKIVIALCDYEGVPPRMTPALIDEACFSYFVDAEASATWVSPAQLNGTAAVRPSVGSPVA